MANTRDLQMALYIFFFFLNERLHMSERGEGPDSGTSGTCTLRAFVRCDMEVGGSCRAAARPRQRLARQSRGHCPGPRCGLSPSPGLRGWGPAALRLRGRGR